MEISVAVAKISTALYFGILRKDKGEEENQSFLGAFFLQFPQQSVDLEIKSLERCEM